MTTNVYDVTTGLMASDSRWSSEHENFIIYLDDTGFNKLLGFDVGGKHFSVMFAGSSYLIHQWKEYLKSGLQSEEPPFLYNDTTMTICLVDSSTREIKFERGQDIFSNDARFAGTGAFDAHGCWKNNRCAKRAVETAKTLDRFSGGEVKYIELPSLNHNMTEQLGIEVLAQLTLDKGMVMYNSNPKGPIPIKEAAANDPAVEQIVKDFSSGKVIANAPCDGMYNPWTEEDKTKLRTALKDIFS